MLCENDYDDEPNVATIACNYIVVEQGWRRR